MKICEEPLICNVLVQRKTLPRLGRSLALPIRADFSVKQRTSLCRLALLFSHRPFRQRLLQPRQAEAEYYLIGFWRTGCVSCRVEAAHKPWICKPAMRLRNVRLHNAQQHNLFDPAHPAAYAAGSPTSFELIQPDPTNVSMTSGVSNDAYQHRQQTRNASSPQQRPA